MAEPSSATSAIALENVEKYFGPTHAVGPLSLDVRPGELVSLLGPSGCGKTTTLRMIAGFEGLTAGVVRIAGRVANDVPIERRGVGMVFQTYALFPHLSVFENVAFGLRLRRLARREIERKVRAALELVGLEPLARRMPQQLSGGQQQRVSLARALAVEPAVLLLDEPLSNLDLKLREQMRDEIRGLQRRLGITAVYVTHDQGEAMAISDRIVVMNRGRIDQIGTPREIYEHPTTLFVARFIGQCSVLAGRFEEDGDGRPWFVSDRGARFGVAPTLVPAGGTSGRRVALVLRPEAVRLGVEAAAGNHGHEAIVQDVVYLGDRTSVVLSLAAGDPVQAADPRRRGRELPRPGDRFVVTVDPADCILVPAEAGNDDAPAAADVPKRGSTMGSHLGTTTAARGPGAPGAT